MSVISFGKNVNEGNILHLDESVDNTTVANAIEKQTQGAEIGNSYNDNDNKEKKQHPNLLIIVLDKKNIQIRIFPC